MSTWVPPGKLGFLPVNLGSSRSTWMSRHQISRKYTSPTVFTFIITMRLFSSYQFLPFLRSSASNALKCKYFKSLSTTSFQVFLDLPLGPVSSTSWAIYLLIKSRSCILATWPYHYHLCAQNKYKSWSCRFNLSRRRNMERIYSSRSNLSLSSYQQHLRME